MPNRIIKESICTSDNIDQLTPFEENVFVRLIVNCDDYGRMDAREKILVSRLFPLKTLKPGQMNGAIESLVKADLVTVYEVSGRPYLQMNTWADHQQIRTKKSKYPSPDEGNCKNLISNDINCNQMITDDNKCPRNPIQSNTNTNPNTKEKEPLKRFTPPTVDEVAEYCRNRNYGIDAEYFVAYYTARNWVLSNGKKMSDWKAAVITWEKREKERTGFAKPTKTVSAGQYTQRDYDGEQEAAMNRMLRGLNADAG